MIHRHIYRGSSNFHIPNYTVANYCISESRIDPIWDLKFIYIKLIKGIYEERYNI